MVKDIELVTKDGKTEARIQCGGCKKTYGIPVDRAKFDEWRGGKWAQDAFPDMAPDWREMFISGTCPSCFDELFRGFDEEDEDDVG